MKFTLTLQALEKNAVLPINYQYPLSAWIYRVLEYGDPVLAQLLHQEGYVEGNRRYKFYSFSELRTVKHLIERDRLILLHPEVSFSIHFLAEHAAQVMVMGLFKEAGAFFLGDKVSGSKFVIRSIQMDMLPPLGESIDLFTVSPVVVSTVINTPEGKLSREYLRPFDEAYPAQIIGNLERKFAAAQTAGLIAGNSGGAHFELLSNEAKEKKIDLMAGTPQYTRVRGYKYRFRLYGSPELLKLALLAGVGEKNAMGFGGVELTRPLRNTN
ncbi:MAG: CRISPR-associated endoribonuclease Cas6 [Haliscomenobacter sp.]|uniref:CRISPR-associated endoribonuclease Cas6 n=1 Tax=Haliscomenobacter sp. TaxID=2717303 RepID=UPI0029A4F64A|nr:CRISPR-associated endoribonuclease Cas6 [Haliscomenobacter sp.]MDX2067385.1 CRISPR-associated endoribonuclease Cas6 [Haliscomenobacter sp.]